MKQFLIPVLALTCFALSVSFPVLADDTEKMLIELKTTDFELAETDISAMAVGEAKTIEKLHQLHKGETDHEIIVIKKEILTED